MALPDGGPLSKYSRQQGYTNAARVTGPDLMKELLRQSATKHYRHYFTAPRRKRLIFCAKRLRKTTPVP